MQLYFVREDQPKIVLFAQRNDALGLFAVNTDTPGTEVRLTQQLNPDDEIFSSVVPARNPTGGGPPRVAYTIIPDGTLSPASYVAEISATPNPRPVGPAAHAVENIRPDGQAVLLSGSTGIVESLVDSALPPVLVTDSLEAGNAHYDTRGDAILTQVFHEDPPGNFILTVGAMVRPAFGTTQHVGTPGKAALFTNLAATDRAIAFIGEGPRVQPTPPVRSFRIALVNAWAPDKLLYLADFVSTQPISGGRLQVIDP